MDRQTADENRGRRLALLIAVLLVVPSLIITAGAIVLEHNMLTPGWFAHLAVGALFAWGIYRGYDWARIYIAVSLLAGAAFLLWKLVAGEAPEYGIVVGLSLVVFNVSASWALLRSRSIEAYFYRQTRAKMTPQALNLSTPEDV